MVFGDSVRAFSVGVKLVLCRLLPKTFNLFEDQVSLLESFGFDHFVVFPCCPLFGCLFMDMGLVLDLLDEIEVGSLFFMVGVFLEVLLSGVGFSQFYWYHSFRTIG